jgi:hypothetical protein
MAIIVIKIQDKSIRRHLNNYNYLYKQNFTSIEYLTNREIGIEREYLMIVFGLLGLIQIGVRSVQGIWMVFLITPAVFYDFSGQRVFFDIINSYFAPLAVALCIAFAYRLKITSNQLNQILKSIWLGCLASLVYPFVKTPDFEKINFTLKAHFETTGGHASNQVATVLGLGMFLSFYSLFKRLRTAV